MSADAPNPHPILPWHREAAKELYAMNRGWSATYENFETVIAAHDPHAVSEGTTLRLLEEAFEYVDEYAENKFLRDKIRAHLAAMKGTQ